MEHKNDSFFTSQGPEFAPGVLMEVQAVHDRVVTRQGAHKLTPGLLQEMVRTHHVVVATVSTLIQKIRETLKCSYTHDMRIDLLH